MLARPGFVLSLASIPTLELPETEASEGVQLMRNDVADIIEATKETVAVYRLEAVYDTKAIAKRAWVLIGTTEADWQPRGGDTVRADTGLKVTYDAKLITFHDVGIQENDKIVRGDGSFEYAVYVQRYAGHITVHLNRTRGSA